MINTTNITTANTFLDQAIALNTATNSVLFTFILFALYGVVLVVFMERGFKEAFVGSSAMTSIVGVIFWSLGLITFAIALYPIILLFIGVVAYVFTKD